MERATHLPPSNREGIDAWLQTLPLELTHTFKGHTPCVEIQQPAEKVFCDAGSGLQNYDATNDSAEGTHYHFFLSHLHWDHIQGFPFFQPAYAARNRITFHTAHREAPTVFKQQMAAPSFPVNFSELKARIAFSFFEPGDTIRLGALSVQTILQPHPNKSCGFRFDLGDQSIVYASDCAHGKEAHEDTYPFLNFFDHADILILDAQFSLTEANTSKSGWGHSNAIIAAELATRAEVKHLVLFHHDRKLDDTVLIERLAQARAYQQVYARALRGMAPDPNEPMQISLAFDGLVLDPSSRKNQ